MKKLKLEIGELCVESFATRPDNEAVRGTVAGQNEPPVTESCDGSCMNTCISCVNTCLNTCQASCWYTCATCYDTCDSWCTHPG